jgi:tetratricopeptide (TPR) repeat protein
MNWFSKLFIKKSQQNLHADKQQSSRKRESLNYFEKGQEKYFNKEKSEALLYFDKSLEYGFADFFENQATTLYDLRAGCLQELEFHYDAINDYNKSISLSKNDCDKYFCRSRSKLAILDYEGAILDIEKAIEVSMIDNEHNRIFNDQAHEQGYKNGAADFYQLGLQRVKMDLDSELESIQKIKNASSQEEKQYRQDMYDEKREKKLNRIKRR